jgi:hypothetical protein
MLSLIPLGEPATGLKIDFQEVLIKVVHSQWSFITTTHSPSLVKWSLSGRIRTAWDLFHSRTSSTATLLFLDISRLS